MGGYLRQKWDEFTQDVPGRRFQDRYERLQRDQGRRGWLVRLVEMLIGLVLVAIGLVLMFMPGPAILFFIVGGGFLAARSHAIARLLDASELAIWRSFRWLKSRWDRASTLSKGGAVVLAISGMGAAGHLVFRVWS